jgi:putative flippase GtrA
LILSGFSSSIALSFEFEKADRIVTDSSFHLVAFIVGGLFTYFGMLLTYQANSKGDGKDYFLRFAALSLPLGIQLFVMALVVVVLLVIASGLTFLLGPSLTTFVIYNLPIGILVAIWVCFVMFFLRMRKYLAIAAGLNDTHAA